MAKRLPVVRGRELLRALERDGWYISRTRGHHVMRHPEHPGSVSVPNHPSELVKPGTLHSILRDTGLTPERLRDLL